MAKEPNSKLDDVQENTIAELLKSGIINDKDEILDKEAFVKFIDARMKKLDSMIESTIKDGVVVDQYTNNLLETEYGYLKEMKKQMAVKPFSGSAYPSTDHMEEYFKKQEQKKEQRVAQGNWLHRLFGRNK